MGTVDIIEDSNGCTPLDEETRERLTSLGCEVVFDFSNNEVVFHLSDERIVVFDFEEFSVQEIDRETFKLNYASSKNQVPEEYLEQVKSLTSVLDTDVCIFGEGSYQYLAIQIYGSYFVIGQILIDIDDFVPPDDDPDGGEPVPDDESGIFI
jgi:hypothetical protein